MATASHGYNSTNQGHRRLWSCNSNAADQCCSHGKALAGTMPNENLLNYVHFLWNYERNMKLHYKGQVNAHLKWFPAIHNHRRNISYQSKPWRVSKVTYNFAYIMCRSCAKIEILAHTGSTILCTFSLGPQTPFLAANVACEKIEGIIHWTSIIQNVPNWRYIALLVLKLWGNKKVKEEAMENLDGPQQTERING